MTAQQPAELNQPTMDTVRRWLVEKIATRLRVEPSRVSLDRRFDELGLDSAEELVLSGELARWIGFEMEPTTLWYYPTITLLAAHIDETMGGGGGCDR